MYYITCILPVAAIDMGSHCFIFHYCNGYWIFICIHLFAVVSIIPLTQYDFWLWCHSYRKRHIGTVNYFMWFSLPLFIFLWCFSFSDICSSYCTSTCAWTSIKSTSSCWSWDTFILLFVNNRVHLAQGKWKILAGWLPTIHSRSQLGLWNHATRGIEMCHSMFNNVNFSMGYQFHSKKLEGWGSERTFFNLSSKQNSTHEISKRWHVEIWRSIYDKKKRDMKLYSWIDQQVKVWQIENFFSMSFISLFFFLFLFMMVYLKSGKQVSWWVKYLWSGNSASWCILSVLTILLSISVFTLVLDVFWHHRKNVI